VAVEVDVVVVLPSSDEPATTAPITAAAPTPTAIGTAIEPAARPEAAVVVPAATPGAAAVGSCAMAGAAPTNVSRAKPASAFFTVATSFQVNRSTTKKFSTVFSRLDAYNQRGLV
jgi:hypothetical protein